MDKFLKALAIFSIFSGLAGKVASNPQAAKVTAAEFANKEIDSLITQGHLPTDFKNDLGTLITDVAMIHPAINNSTGTVPAAS